MIQQIDTAHQMTDMAADGPVLRGKGESRHSLRHSPVQGLKKGLAKLLAEFFLQPLFHFHAFIESKAGNPPVFVSFLHFEDGLLILIQDDNIHKQITL